MSLTSFSLSFANHSTNFLLSVLYSSSNVLLSAMLYNWLVQDNDNYVELFFICICICTTYKVVHPCRLSREVTYTSGTSGVGMLLARLCLRPELTKLVLILSHFTSLHSAFSCNINCSNNFRQMPHLTVLRLFPPEREKFQMPQKVTCLLGIPPSPSRPRCPPC